MALLEILQPRGYPNVTLDGDRLTIGKSDDNDLAIADDPTLSRHHALLERVGAAWSVSDLGAKNGTLVNGLRVVGTQVLKHADELTLGETAGSSSATRRRCRATRPRRRMPPPKLTPAERKVLIELVRPWVTGNAFTLPASVKEIAERRFTTEAAVKNHLGRLYDKFGIIDGDNKRRATGERSVGVWRRRARDFETDDEAEG